MIVHKDSTAVLTELFFESTASWHKC